MGAPDAGHSQKRSSTATNGFSALPEVDLRINEDLYGKQLMPADGKEAVNRDVGGLEALPVNEKQHYQTSGLEIIGSEDKEAVETYPHYGEGAVYHQSSPEERARSTSRHRRRRIWLAVSVALLLVLGIALGVGLGIGLKGDSLDTDQSRPQDSGPSSAVNASQSPSSPSTMSTRGAFNGSGISMRRQGNRLNLTSGEVGTSYDDPHNLLLAFQHHTGELRWMQRVSPNTWQGGSESESITTWAKNGTPLSILGSGNTAESKQEWHVFCENILSPV